MSDWASLLERPEGSTGDRIADWFEPIADRLLNGCRLLVNGAPHRFVEVEFYYHGAGHLDTFTHRDPLQHTRGRWYFHRTRGVYRGGSFKGVDLTFGDDEAFGGVLIRGIEAADGKLIDGPSLCVDHLLAQTGAADVAALDKRIAGRVGWNTDNPLQLVIADNEKRPLFRTPRVGLSLKRLRASPEPPRYIMRSYRYLSEPRLTAKGKLLLVLSLHAQGKEAEEITQLTGCPRGTVKRYVDDFKAGQQEDDFTPYIWSRPGTEGPVQAVRHLAAALRIVRIAKRGKSASPTRIPGRRDTPVAPHSQSGSGCPVRWDRRHAGLS